MVMKIQVVVFGIPPQHYMLPKSRRQWLKHSLFWISINL